MILLYVICVLVLYGALLFVWTPWNILVITPAVVGAVSTFPRHMSVSNRTVLILVTGILALGFSMLNVPHGYPFGGWRHQMNSEDALGLFTGSVLLLCSAMSVLLIIAHLRMSDLDDRWALVYAIFAAAHAQNGHFATWSAAWVMLALLLMLAVRALPGLRFTPTSIHVSAATLQLATAGLCLVYPEGGHWTWPLAAACASLLGGSSLMPIAAVPVMAWYSETWSGSSKFVPNVFEVTIAVLLWGALFIGLIRGWRTYRRGASLLAHGEKVTTASVVIPARNEADHIQSCIRSARVDGCVCEVIVVDAGSSDETVVLSERAGARVVRHDGHTRRGRGGHIQAGVAAARGDVVVVLHADTELAAGSIQNAVELLQRRPRVVGGAMGSVFDSGRLMLRCIEAANDFRAAFLGISFGDQVQFFRRRVAIQHGLVPDYPLMEDVELSMRFKRYSTPAYLFGVSRVSPRNWVDGSRKRAVLIIRLVAGFLWARRHGDPDVEKMYRQYYSSSHYG